MNQMYEAIGISKQSFFQWKARQAQKQGCITTIANIIGQVRKDHPGMGVRTIWEEMRPPMGRDEFEYLALLNGFGVQVKKNFRKTTDSFGVTRFANLIKDLELTDVNQVWVSDITYYRMINVFYYLTFIMDLYSRKLLGYSVSRNLEAETTTIAALEYAIKSRSAISEGSSIILHSDGGGQYYDKIFLKLERANNITSSMCKTVYENPHAERLNGHNKKSIYLSVQTAEFH